jgi:hypothetical protein
VKLNLQQRTHSVLQKNQRNGNEIKEKEEEISPEKGRNSRPSYCHHYPTVAQPPQLRKSHHYRPRIALHTRVGSHSIHLSLSRVDLSLTISMSLMVCCG